MLLRITIITLLLAWYIQYIEGIEKVIVVSESFVDDDALITLISYDEDSPVNSATDTGNGSHVSSTLCCIYGNCFCPSLYTALANLTSNVLINITTDVVLFSIIPLANFANITITGHDNPTVAKL